MAAPLLLLIAQAATVPLPPVAAEFPVPFYALSQIRVLSGNDAVVDAALMTERLHLSFIHYLDWAGGTTRPAGQSGRGPLDYASQRALIAAAGDTTWLVDRVKRRLLVLDPAGRAVATLALPPHADTIAQGTGPLYEPRFADDVGSLYDIEGPSVELRGATHDSLAIRRWRDRGTTADTLAWLDRRIWYANTEEHAMPLVIPFRHIDDWAVTAGGTVVIVRAREYRVDRVTPSGALQRGPRLPYTPRKVTNDDRKRWADEIRSGARRLGMPDNSDALRQSEWPAERAAFDGRIVLGPDGVVWVPLTPAKDGEPVIYDVVAADGAVRQRVTVPAGVEVVAFGPGTMYTTRRDQRGLWLQRRPWPQ